MAIIAITIYRDMLIFFRNQFASILLLALLTAIISFFLAHVLSPGQEQLMTLSNIENATSLQQFLQQMSVEQQRILIQASAAGTIAGLVSNVLLAGGILTMLRLVTNQQPFSVLRAIVQSIPIFPRLFLQMFVTTLLVQLGLLLIILPGILIAIACSLAPIIATSDHLDPIKSIRMSARIAFSNLWLLAPAVLFWMLTKASVLLLAPVTMAFSPLAAMLLNSLSNLISALLLIYLYRLYMLLRL